MEILPKPVDYKIHNLLKRFNIAEIVKITLYQVLLWSPNPGVYTELGTSQIESWIPITKPGPDAHGAATMQGTKNNFSLSSKPVSSKDKKGHQPPGYTKVRPALYFCMAGVFLCIALRTWLIKYFCNDSRTFMKVLLSSKRSRQTLQQWALKAACCVEDLQGELCFQHTIYTKPPS